MKLQDLKIKTPEDLLKQAEDLEIENASSLRKKDLMFAILKKLADKNPIMGEGVIETMLNKEDLNYVGACTLNDVKNFFQESSYEIIEEKYNAPKELNVYFKNKRCKNTNKISINKFNPRFLRRITENRLNFKDNIYIYYLKKLRLKII